MTDEQIQDFCKTIAKRRGQEGYESSLVDTVKEVLSAAPDSGYTIEKTMRIHELEEYEVMYKGLGYS